MEIRRIPVTTLVALALALSPSLASADPPSAEPTPGASNPLEGTAKPTAGALTPPTVSPFASARRFVIDSEVLGEQRAVDIALPASYEISPPSRAFPVVFVLDGEFQFQTVAAVVAHLSSVGRMPESIVIGLPNPPGGRLDLFPPLLGDDGKARASRADLHITYFRDELVPFLEARWRVAPFRIVIGLSPTAAFALHTFAKAPELFRAHIAMVIGGTLGYRYSPTQTLAEALQHSMAQEPNRQAFLYLGSASSNHDESGKISAQLDRLGEALTPFAAKNLRFRSEVIPGSAYAIALESVISAFEMIFPRHSWETDYLAFMRSGDDAAEALDTYFSELSADYGFEVAPLPDRFYNVHCLRGLGSRLSSRGRLAEAQAVFKRWTEYFPGDPHGYFRLAGALERSDEHEEAFLAAKRGLELARKTTDPDLDFYETAYRQLEARLSGDD